MVERFKAEIAKNASFNSISHAHEASSAFSFDFHKELSSFKLSEEINPIKARMLNFAPATKIKQLKTSMFQKFVSITGTVVRITNSKSFVKRLAFECKKCSTTFVIFVILIFKINKQNLIWLF